MKKLIVFLLVLASTASAQVYPVSRRLDSMTVMVCQQLGIPTTGDRKLTSAIIRKQINSGIARVCTDFPAIEKMDTVVIAKTTEGGALPTDFQRAKAVYRIKGDSLRIPLVALPEDSIAVIANTPAMNVQNKTDDFSPRYYYTFAQRLMLHPPYNRAASDSLLVEYYAMDTTLVGDTSKTQILPEYVAAIVDYACAKLSRVRGRDTDAEAFMLLYDRARGIVPLSREVEQKK